MDKTNESLENFDCYISGDIKQSQNCDIDVQQPNNNVVASQDINTQQNNKQLDETLIKGEKDNINHEESKGEIIQNANSKQNSEQPESNICEASAATIQQNNTLDNLNNCKREE